MSNSLAVALKSDVVCLQKANLCQLVELAGTVTSLAAVCQPMT